MPTSPHLALHMQVVSGVPLSALGGCVVAAGKAGVWARPSDMSLEELGVELEASGEVIPAAPKRTTLLRMVKARREALPDNVKELQKRLVAEAKAEAAAVEAQSTGATLQSKGRGRLK